MTKQLSQCAILISTALVSFSAWSSPKEIPHCHQLLSDYNIIASDEVIDATDNSFVYHDLGYDFHFLAGVRDRVLTLDVLLVDPDRKIRSHYSGTNLYQHVMEHFGPLNIDVIEGLWQSGDNYEAFLENLSRGHTPESAALNTWSGRQARMFGFSQVRVVDWDQKSRRPEKIVVEFVRPSKAPKVVKGKIRTLHKTDTFHIKDSTFDYEFYAHLQGGHLFINASLFDYQNNQRSALSGADLYDEMIAKFGKENIDVIDGIWTDGTNHQMFFSNLAKGLSPEEAAVLTWSGQQAARHGFTRVAYLHWGWSVVQGTSIVTVEFEKP